MVYSSPAGQILDLLILNALANDIFHEFHENQKIEFVLDRVKIFWKKGKNGGYQQIIYFPWKEAC